jgi:large subunit ribosomal protein L25
MAEPRTVLGKKNGALRRTGKIPGVVYGPGYESTIQVQVERREFERFYQQHGLNKPFTLNWGDGQARVVMRDVQLNHLGNIPLHVDFYVGPKQGTGVSSAKAQNRS